MREVDLGSGRALLIKEHGEFSAMGHKCPHYGAPLVKGKTVSVGHRGDIVAILDFSKFE